MTILLRPLRTTLSYLLRLDSAAVLSTLHTTNRDVETLNKFLPCVACQKHTCCKKKNFYNSVKAHKTKFLPTHHIPVKWLHHDISSSQTPSEQNRYKNRFALEDIELDWDFLLNKENLETIKTNICNRKGVGDIKKLHELVKQYEEGKGDLLEVRSDLIQAALEIPNSSHSQVPVGDESEAVLVKTVGPESIKDLGFKPKTVVELGNLLDTLRVSEVSLTTGSSTYYLKGAFARLEQALVQYTIDALKKKGFKLLSVPDLLYTQVIEGCGFKTTGENQVYKLEPGVYGNVCLAGTGEMALAGFCMNQTSPQEEMPQKWMTVSQCYRAETSSEFDERGIYRVHHFTKVEMFGVTANETGLESQNLLEDFLDIQTELFSALGIHFRILDMPTHELGASAHRKYDMEAWMVAKGTWGEISSCSDCTDYQTRRLGIKYHNDKGELKHAHTVNGTACAVPRMIMALAETHQKQDHSIHIPEVLQPYMGDVTVITKDTDAGVMKPVKVTKTAKRSKKM